MYDKGYTGCEAPYTPYTQHTPKVGPSRPSRPSFRDAVRFAEVQIELNAIDERQRAQARELCYIIAEVYLMNPDAPIRISGELLDGHVVQQVFHEITADHVMLVIENFSRNTYAIKNKKAYLRTSLYNSVFELEASIENDFRCSESGAGGTL